MGRSTNVGIHVPSAKSPQPTSNVAVALGWINGVLIALVIDFALYNVMGDVYPQGPATVLLFAIFALTGAKLAERLGRKALRPMAIAAGVLIALYITAGLSVWMTHSERESPADGG